MKILVGSPISESKTVLRMHFNSLCNLTITSDIELHFFCIDNTKNHHVREVLNEFDHPFKTVTIMKRPHLGEYRDKETHDWKSWRIEEVAKMRNEVLKFAIDCDYDYLFMVDSDLVLSKDTLMQLIESNKHIVSAVFWTKWDMNVPELPNVWMVDAYGVGKETDFISKLRTPGLYEVGGLGACTLFSNAAVKDNSYSPIRNLTIAGEDRWFCIRAVAKGWDLWANTYPTIKHYYR